MALSWPERRPGTDPQGADIGPARGDADRYPFLLGFAAKRGGEYRLIAARRHLGSG
jgi:hypothetical protein